VAGRREEEERHGLSLASRGDERSRHTVAAAREMSRHALDGRDIADDSAKNGREEYPI